MKPFWRYYGGKFRAAPKYPAPRHSIIIEPFAGAAGYAMRYPDLNVILVEKYPVVAGIWRYLISATPEEIRAVPDCVDTRELPDWVPQEARWLAGFWLNAAATGPRITQSAGKKYLTATGRKMEFWNASVKERIAGQVGRIRHWRVVEGEHTEAPDIEATWFVDPPYNNKAGSYYKHGSKSIDYPALGAWCKARRGQVMVCENDGADWLPFRPFMSAKAGPSKGRSSEALWVA